MATAADRGAVREEITIRLDSGREIPAKTIAAFLTAHNQAYRKFCEENGVAPRDLVVTNSGTASWWALLSEAYGLIDLASSHADFLASFMTEFSAVVSKAKTTSILETRPSFIGLLKEYRKAIRNYAVTGIFIGHAFAGQVTFTSPGEVERIVRTLKPRNRSTQKALGKPVVERRRADIVRMKVPDDVATFEPLATMGTAKIFDRVLYVQLEGMGGALLPASGEGGTSLRHDHSYSFRGKKLLNRAGEAIGFHVVSASQIGPSFGAPPLLS